MSQFSYQHNATVRLPRSRFDLSYNHKTSLNVGELVPFMFKEVYPGDTFKVEGKFVARATSSFIRPVMDDLFMDEMYFFVPNRVVDNNFVKIFGDTGKAWASDASTYVAPQVALPATCGKEFVGTLGDYFGALAPGVNTSYAVNVSQYPFRAYAKIWNDWFRDENFEDEVDFAPSTPAGGWKLNADDFAPGNIFGKPAIVAKVHDRYTSALPATQKGDAVKLPILASGPNAGFAPVTNHYFTSGELFIPTLYSQAGTTLPSNGILSAWAPSPGGNSILGVSTSTPSASPTQAATMSLGADLSKAIDSVSVNDLRFSFQLQKQLERMARGGSRYTEYVSAAFGVTSPDSRLQRSEFLGGSRNPLSVQQVAQTSQATEASPLASLGAFSLSAGKARFTKSFTEHGFVIGLACVRYYHTYQQGIDPSLRRFTRTSFYDPVFANISEQPIYKTELYAGADPASIFGYVEAWNDLRKSSNKISGALRSGSGFNLDLWHFGDYYASAPTLNAQFIHEYGANVMRTLSVEDTSVAPAFIVDFWNGIEAIRCMPTWSIPGLIDHH